MAAPAGGGGAEEAVGNPKDVNFGYLRNPQCSMDWFVGENLNRKPMGFYHEI